MDHEDRDEPSHIPLTDEALEAFLDTVQLDTKIQDDRKALENKVAEKIAATLALLNYHPLEMASERFMLELNNEIEKLLHETAVGQQLEYEGLRSLPQEHELKRTIREWAIMRLDERAHRESSSLTLLSGDLTKLELTIQDYQQGTPEYDEVIAMYTIYKKKLYAYWMVRQKFEPDNPVLLAVSKLFPGAEIDPTSEEMVPYLAEAITTLPDKAKSDKRAGEFHQKVHDALNLNEDNDRTYDKRSGVGRVIAYASLLQIKGNITSAEREELVREKAREEIPFINQQLIGTVILLINQEYPV